MSTTTVVDADAVRRAVESVPDPELPPVTVGMLGMVEDVTISGDGAVTVDLLPTWSGCPATDAIRDDVEDAVRAVDGVRDVEVRFRFDPPWSVDRIDDEGREALRSFGITPPDRRGGAAPVTAVEVPDGVTPLPVTGRPARTCPYCGSADTTLDSPFGPTPCRSIHFCEACRQPFEAFKS